MIGAIVGDIVGSRFEEANCKSKDFELFTDYCFFTDDSVLTMAVAQALADWRERGSSDTGELSALSVRAMQDFGRRYPRAGYGGHFAQWIGEADPRRPYNSWEAARGCV